MKITRVGRKGSYLTRFAVFLTTAALIAGVAGCDGDGGYNPPTTQNLEIRTWSDLDAVRDNLDGDHILMNNLDSTTAGYTILASQTAHGGKGWEPIDNFLGSFDGQGYEIRDLFVDRPREDYVGLFGSVEVEGVIRDVGVVSATVIGAQYVGGLAGLNSGTISGSYSTGSVIGNEYVGGLVGRNLVPASTFPIRGTVNNCCSTGSVTGDRWVGGLVGENLRGTVSNSYSTGSVTGNERVGGLVGQYCYAAGGTVSNSHYNYGEVLINSENIITRGALFDEDFDEWLANNKSLDINERLYREDDYYVINGVSDFKQLLAFGQDGSLKFRLKNDLDLGDDLNFYIPYFAGEFDGNGHRIWNLSLNIDFVYSVGLFGHLAPGGNVTDLAVENVNISGNESIGGLVGFNEGTVSDSYSTGSVNGQGFVGGVVGHNWYLSTVTNSHFTGTVVGDCNIGGLMGQNMGTVTNSYSNGQVYGVSWSVGGLAGHNGGTVSNSYSTASVASDNNVGGLVGENGGDGTVSNSYSTGDVTSYDNVVGGLVGGNYGTVSNCYSTGSVSGSSDAGGLVGGNGYEGTVSNCYSSGRVTANERVGGLVAVNLNGTVSNSYSTGSVTGSSDVGGLLGYSEGEDNVSNSFWDVETSGQGRSAGGTGKTTAEMQDVATFSGAGWNIIAIADSDTRSTEYTWNIVNEVTYPFLSWEI